MEEVDREERSWIGIEAIGESRSWTGRDGAARWEGGLMIENSVRLMLTEVGIFQVYFSPWEVAASEVSKISLTRWSKAKGPTECRVGWFSRREMLWGSEWCTKLFPTIRTIELCDDRAKGYPVNLSWVEGTELVGRPTDPQTQQGRRNDHPI
jgi:hypothetical protein